MLCPKCGHKNDSDAKYCENCGTPLKKPDDRDGLGKTTKILIIFCIVLIAALGITAGVLFKNSQGSPDLKTQNQSNNSVSKEQISQNSGFPVSETPNLAYEISKYSGPVGSVSYGSVTLDKNQCIYLLAQAVVMINKGEQGNIPIKTIASAEIPQGNINSASITKTQYIDIASRTYTWIDNYGATPNYVGITNPGQPDLSPDTTLKLFSKVLAQYKSTGQLPESISIP